MMNQTKCCPYCPSPLAACPHLLIVMGRPGEAVGGALAERLVRMWQIVIGHVGDDPALDARGVYSESWQALCVRFGRASELAIEGDDWVAMFIKDVDQMDAVVENCISADDL